MTEFSPTASGAGQRGGGRDRVDFGRVHAVANSQAAAREPRPGRLLPGRVDGTGCNRRVDDDSLWPSNACRTGEKMAFNNSQRHVTDGSPYAQRWTMSARLK